MAGAGFEPAKAKPTGLQPVPFDRSGTPPRAVNSRGPAPQPALCPLPLLREEPVSRRLHDVAQPLRLGQRLELLERVVLDLADALARDVERAPDLLQRARPAARQAEAHLDDLALALRQRRQRTVHVLLAEVLRGDLERRLGRLVLDEVAELGLVLLADRLLER